LRQEIIDTCLEMNSTGLNQGTAGNASARVEGGLLITPTGIPYRDLRTDDIVFLRSDGTVESPRAPSSEWRFHLDILNARPEVGAVVHAHPVYSSSLAIMGMEIPALHYMVAAAGGNTIRCAEYATYGTAELSRNALAALEGRKACLLAHHGIIATGPDLTKALWLAVEVETLAREYVYTMQMGGPRILPDDEIARVLELFETYGQPKE
jgi:L-fuculose-phosphate aldolase